MRNEAASANSTAFRLYRAFPVARRIKAAIEAGYDTVTWLSGLLAAAWVTGTGYTTLSLAALSVLVGLTASGAGLFAGLYRHHYQRGSLDELAGIALAACTTGLTLLLLTLARVAPSPALPRTVAGAGMFAVAAMLGGRHILVGLRLRARAPASRGHRHHRVRGWPGRHDPGAAADARPAGQIPAGRAAGRRSG